jgi:hypothetical protein
VGDIESDGDIHCRARHPIERDGDGQGDVADLIADAERA